MTEAVKPRRKYHTKNSGVDFEKELSERKRCPQCKRQTTPETDFINVKNGKNTKLCIMCRTSATDSIRRNPIKKKTMSMSDKVALYEKIITLVSPDIIGKILEENELELPRDFINVEQMPTPIENE